MTWERELHYFINRHLAVPALDPWMRLFSAAWFWWAVAAAVSLILVARGKGRLLWIWVPVLLALGLSDALCTYVLKPWLARPRPCHALVDVRVAAYSCGSWFGLPSNHASNGMAVALALWLVSRSRWALWAFLGAALSGYSRIHLSVHYPGDVALGFLTGAAVAGLVYLGVRRPRRGGPKAPAPGVVGAAASGYNEI